MYRYERLGLSLSICLLSSVPLAFSIWLATRQSLESAPLALLRWALVIAVGAILSLLVYGFVSDFRHRQHGDGSSIEVYVTPRTKNAPDNAIILLPAMTNSGSLVYGPLVHDFTKYGDVFVVEWPRHGFESGEICSQILRQIDSYGAYHAIVVVGQSLGAPLGLELIQTLRDERASYGLHWARVEAFVGVSGFTTQAEFVHRCQPGSPSCFVICPLPTTTGAGLLAERPAIAASWPNHTLTWTPSNDIFNTSVIFLTKAPPPSVAFWPI